MMIISEMVSDVLKSRTLQVAWAKKLLGLVTLITANAGYFENSMSVMSFGIFMIALGVVDNYLRHITTKPLCEK